MKQYTSRTSPEGRISQFPGEPLKVDGVDIRCCACKRTYRNKWSAIAQHVRTELHIKAVEELQAREEDDKQLKVWVATLPVPHTSSCI